MKHLIYICILSATTAMLTLGACDKKDTIPDEPKETPPPVVIPPLDPDAPEPGGAIIADPPVLSGSFTHYPDNHYRIVQRSTENNAYTLLVVGDGYSGNDFLIRDDGRYEQVANKVIDLFRRNYVIRDYYHYFNVVVYYAHSPMHGANSVIGQSRFGSHLGDNKNGMISDSLQNIAARLTGVANLKNVFVIFPVVGNIGASPHNYGGGGWAPYPDGDSPGDRESNPPYWMMHEFIGHIIGQFPDMYTREGGQFMGVLKREIDASHAAGQLWMIDYNKNFPTDDTAPDSSEIFWSRFLYEPGYRNIVGIHKGMYNQTNENIYVPQPDNTNGMCTPGINTYDAPSRYQMWMRMQKTVGRDYSLERFFAYDTVWNTKQTDYRAAPPEVTD